MADPPLSNRKAIVLLHLDIVVPRSYSFGGICYSSPYACTLSPTGGLLCMAIFWLQKMRTRFVVSQGTIRNASMLSTPSEVRASMKLVSHS
mmetsp:Transcript_4735/g.11323  ORF Transcript_4735/g.11323 Transcript_4735/m.11323 type:complete len:91 (-) Transcript_4735:130-402(-)